MALSLALPAFFAGLLMFLAPCTLPLVPAYLAFIAGVPEGDSSHSARRKILFNALAFVIGFSLVFILFGVFAGALGGILGVWRYELSRVAGVLLILFGFTMLGLLRLPVLSGEFKAHIPSFLTLGKWQASAFIGILFAFGWSPCIGPILGSILFLATSSATAAAGGILLAIFSLGLAIPFLLIAFLTDRASRVISKLGAFPRVFQIIGACILIVLGLLMAIGQMGLLVEWGFGLFDGYGALLNHL